MGPEYGRVPPQSIEMEEAVIGALMLEKAAYTKISNILTDKMFYKDSHARVYRVISKLFHNGNPVDMLTVTDELKNKGELAMVGGPYAITILTSRVSSSANIEYHARIIKQKWILREMISVSSTILKEAFEDTTDCFELLSDAQKMLRNINDLNEGQITHISAIFKEVSQQIDKNLLSNDTLSGIPTGFTYFDNHSSGLQKGDLIIVAGETSNGKTALALNIAAFAAKTKHKVAIYSYEMSDRQLATRLLAPECNIGSKSILYKKLSAEELDAVNSGIGRIGNQEIYIDDLKSSKYDYLENSIQSMVTRYGIELIVIDYLQLIKNPVKGGNKAESTAEIANNLKALAKQLDVPIILISQLARDKANPSPTLARLKGSGDIENAADIVWLVFQPTLYNWETFECRGDVINAEGNSMHDIAKGRNIGVTQFVLKFRPEVTQFSNYVSPHEIISVTDDPKAGIIPSF